jgi:hypothetical protein
MQHSRLPNLETNQAVRRQLARILSALRRGQCTTAVANAAARLCHEAFLINSFELHQQVPIIMEQIRQIEAEHERLREGARKPLPPRPPQTPVLDTSPEAPATAPDDETEREQGV